MNSLTQVAGMAQKAKVAGGRIVANLPRYDVRHVQASYHGIVLVAGLPNHAATLLATMAVPLMEGLTEGCATMVDAAMDLHG